MVHSRSGFKIWDSARLIYCTLASTTIRLSIRTRDNVSLAIATLNRLSQSWTYPCNTQWYHTNSPRRNISFAFEENNQRSLHKEILFFSKEILSLCVIYDLVFTSL